MARYVYLLRVLFLSAGAMAAPKTLDIYFIDVEGGQATLIVSPSGQSMLVDAGWPGFNGRDADRIVAAAKKAGLKRIDLLLMTHYHTDHVGGVPPLLERFPVAHVIDHGPNTETGKSAEALSEAYAKAIEKLKHSVVKPGDVIPLKGVDILVVSARGELIKDPLPGAGQPNPLCGSDPRRPEDTTENGKSIGFLLRHGKFRFVNLADITWNIEMDLVCPVNRVGPVDVYLVTHHGTNMSGSATIVRSLRPRVAVMNNGAKKGGSPEAWRVIRDSPGLEDIWQLHFALAGGKETNAPDPLIANPEPQCEGHFLKLSAKPDGSFLVMNGRNGYQKTYAAR